MIQYSRIFHQGVSFPLKELLMVMHWGKVIAFHTLLRFRNGKKILTFTHIFVVEFLSQIVWWQQQLIVFIYEVETPVEVPTQVSSGQTLGVKAQRFRGHTSPHRNVKEKKKELQTGYKDMKLFPQAQQTKEELLDILEMARTVGTPGVAPRKPNIVRGTGPSVMPAPTQTVQKQQQQAQQPVIQQKQQSVVSGTNGKPKNPWRRVP
eukprot:TRINITY_DN7114_c0_g2_i1.p3 TRINITY_DN7114_c0_g2~~TRINITY_DN7114_c0_g2_i1.p3  ORF type:complete len:206 (-),score=36.69 TRINITY_DN7114_c0_g2_i1:550-1167(-)